MVIHYSDDFVYAKHRVTLPNRKQVWRTTWVKARLIRRKKTKYRTVAANPLSGDIHSHLNDLGETELARIGFDNGHLIALELGGPNLGFNIVPMFSYFNQVKYRALENLIFSDASVTHMKVDIIYRDKSSAIPETFLITLTNVLGKTLILPPSTMVQHAASVYAPASDNEWPKLCKTIRDHFPESKDHERPYAFMDALRPALGLSQPQKTTDFSATERRCIYYANSLYSKQQGHEAFLMSDLPLTSDPFATLVEMGGNNRPQVDHILAKSWGGPNSFANAQLISKYANNQKKNSVTAQQRDAAMAGVRRSKRLLSNEPTDAKKIKTHE